MNTPIEAVTTIRRPTHQRASPQILFRTPHPKNPCPKKSPSGSSCWMKHDKTLPDLAAIRARAARANKARSPV
ncbi:MAG: hypothetical protein WA940_13750, partial [Sphingopyxis sp.]